MGPNALRRASLYFLFRKVNSANENQGRGSFNLMKNICLPQTDPHVLKPFVAQPLGSLPDES